MKKTSRVFKYLTSIAIFATLIVALVIVFNFSTVTGIARSTFSIIGYIPNQFAAVILSHNFKSVAEIRAKYNSMAFNSRQISRQGNNFWTWNSDGGVTEIRPSKVRVLLVPGHEPNYGGAEFSNLRERDMNVELAQNLREYLVNDPHFEVYTARDEESWSPFLTAYFQNNWDNIADWVGASREEFSRMVEISSTTSAVPPAINPIPKVVHNNAPRDVALRLYGITKWSSENNIDIVIHIHFNDVPRKNSRQPGKHFGFAIYIPDNQYGNSSTTRAVAEKIFKRLAAHSRISNLPGESNGIVDESELIAIGANNTADAASMLIEYGYIYEPQFQNDLIRTASIRSMAFQTYLGLQDFLDPNLEFLNKQ